MSEQTEERPSLDEFQRGIEERMARIVMAASDCVTHLRRHGFTKDAKAMSQIALIKAVDEWHRYSTNGGKPE